ncbi:hypothetical protein SCAR479_02963 [Seiridium cardinale]|uniref:Cytochrome P450 n=1 Tax=Seiridium cardinale TaxID=138064 RepID=A0ABR2Y364_9PEZI
MAPVEFDFSTWESIDFAKASSTLALGVLSLTFLYNICTWIYNIYFHPLSSFPGPKWTAASSLWYARGLSRGSLSKDFLKMHDKYGPVVRVAPDELSFIEPGAFKEIYGYKRPELEKDKKYHSGLGGDPTILNSDQHHHAELRKLMSHGFSDGSLRAQEPIVQENLHLLIRKIADASKDGQVPVDMVAWYNFFTFDVIGYLTYGETFDCLANSNLHTWVQALFSLIYQMAQAQAVQRLPRILRRPYAKWFINSDVRSKVKSQWDLSQAKVNSRMETPSRVPDFMEKLIEAYHNGKLSANQLNGNAQLLIGAGSETTATLLSGLTFLLMTHPHVQQRLIKEIRETFSSPEEITMIGVNGCKYLLACIEEALRVYPPSPSTHPRYVPEGGKVIADKFVPGNMAVGISIYAAAHSERNFHRASEFLPERWMGEDPSFAGDKKEALQPFSYGPRNCIGRNLAYVEMKLVIANLLWHFDLENCTEGNWLDQKIFLVWEKRPLMVKLKPARG